MAKELSCPVGGQAVMAGMMLNTLGHVRAAYRTTEDHLRTIDVAAAQIASVRDRLRQ